MRAIPVMKAAYLVLLHEQPVTAVKVLAFRGQVEAHRPRCVGGGLGYHPVIRTMRYCPLLVLSGMVDTAPADISYVHSLSLVACALSMRPSSNIRVPFALECGLMSDRQRLSQTPTYHNETGRTHSSSRAPVLDEQLDGFIKNLRTDHLRDYSMTVSAYAPSCVGSRSPLVSILTLSPEGLLQQSEFVPCSGAQRVCSPRSPAI